MKRKYPQNYDNWPVTWKSCFDDGFKSANTEAKNLLREIAECGFTDSDPGLKRISWIEVQVERELWERIQEAVR